MNNKLTDPYRLNSGIVAAMRQADAMRDYDQYASIVKEANRIEEMRKLIEVPEHITTSMRLTSSFLEEQRQIEEMQKLCDTNDYIKSATDKLNLIPDLGYNSIFLDEQKRIEEVHKIHAVPLGIAGMVIKDMEQMESRRDFLYPEPSKVPVDFPIIRPLPDPMHKTNKILEKNEQQQAEIAGHLEKIALQGEGTSKQNEQMLFWAKIAAIGTIAGLLIAYFSFQAGQNSSVPVPPSVPVVKAVPAPVMSPGPTPAPVHTKK